MPRKSNKSAKPATEAAKESTAATVTEETAANDEQAAYADEDTVEALVLCDSVHGKCGEVKRFPEHAIKSLAAAGFIDPHPNAVAAHRKA